MTTTRGSAAPTPNFLLAGDQHGAGNPRCESLHPVAGVRCGKVDGHPLDHGADIPADIAAAGVNPVRMMIVQLSWVDRPPGPGPAAVSKTKPGFSVPAWDAGMGHRANSKPKKTGLKERE